MLALVLLCAALYLPGISLRDLWRPDEVRYTEVAREMEVTGSLILPRLNGRPYADKPPLYFWLAILAKKALGQGWSPVPARLVTAAAATATVILTFILACRLGMAEGALAAGIVTATSAEFLWMARWGAMDTLFGFFILLSLYAFLRAWTDRSRTWTAASYLAASMAVLAKGPLALLVIAVTAGVTVGRIDGLRAVAPRSLAWGVPLMLAPIAAWLIPDIHLAGGWDHAREVLFAQNLGRLSPTTGAHRQPLYYYLVNFPPNLLPWTLFLPVGLYLLWRDASMDRRARVFLGAYFVATFLVLSVLPPKREKYLLPIYPGAALLVGYLLSGREPVRKAWGHATRIAGRIFSWLVAACGVGLVVSGLWGVGLGTAFAPEFAPEIVTLLGAPRTRVLLVLGGAVMAISALLLRPRRDKDPEHRILLTAVVFWFVIVVVAGIEILPRADAFKSVRGFCDTLEEEAGPARPVALYRNLYQGAFNFYLARTHIPVLRDVEALRRFLSRLGRPVVIVDTRHLEGIQESGQVPYEVLFTRRFEDTSLAAISLSRATGKGEAAGKP